MTALDIIGKRTEADEPLVVYVTGWNIKRVDFSLLRS